MFYFKFGASDIFLYV